MYRYVAFLAVTLWLKVSATTTFEVTHPAAEAAKMGFALDKAHGTFLLDGAPFRYVSGSIHYFRVHPHLWRDRLRKLRAAGFNTVQTYVEWSRHQPEDSDHFVGVESELERFLVTAMDEGLLVLLRPGPFIDAERDFGGLPWWLLARKPRVQLRSADPQFMAAVERWFEHLYGRLRKFMRHNGGPIIAVQIENEFGSFGCDLDYLSRLKHLALQHLGGATFLFTTDGYHMEQMRCGAVPDAFSTVDFGTGANVSAAFALQRLFAPSGPAVNSEFYPGWLDHWGHRHSKVPSQRVAAKLSEMLSAGASVNVYLAHGGSSFGFSAGSTSPPFQPCPTSYDYDAPISEAGDLTDKYFDLQAVIGKFLPLPSIAVANSTKRAYGRVKMAPVGSIFHLASAALSVESQSPLSFEDVGQDKGFVIYQTRIKFATRDPAKLVVSNISDRGYVYVGGRFWGILSRWGDIDSMPVTVRKGDTLQIVVENQGRVCFGEGLFDRKGIFADVTLDGKKLTGWTITPLKLDPLGDALKSFVGSTAPVAAPELRRMSLWRGSFSGPCSDGGGRDTFLRVPGWTKGVAWVNGFNLGRYWPAVGPQRTLYVPAPVVRGECQENEVVLLEQDGATCVGDGGDVGGCHVEFVRQPNIDGPTPQEESQEKQLVL